MKKSKKFLSGGYSIVEMLVVVGVFSILAVVTTQVVALSIRGTKKSDSVITTKENVDYAMSTMERLLRNAQSISSCSPTVLEYVDEFGNTAYFRCVGGGGMNGAMASESASLVQLTSPDVGINCSAGVFNCPPVPTGTEIPPTVIINLTARYRGLSGAESAQVTSQSSVQLRTY